ncbi:translocation/assembly module TamB domain-containing protein [Breoghania sp.]|uniref:translocation/assembly module TamB domain-containing protein n=1 Tax=Breoghania sp. TaxID=2065378 RepID=UPI0029C7B581|nr:translocation/assembly module TamB domain-containing protein [Breoghania sp.]
MKAIRKPILIVILILVVGCLIVFSGLTTWIGSSSGRYWLQSRIDTVIAGTVTIDDIRLSLIAPRLELAGVTLYDPQGTKVAGFDRFSITLRWLPLLSREVHITNIDLKSPWADLIQDKVAGLNLMAAVAVSDSEKNATAPPEDGSGLPVNIVCDALHLSSGRLSFKMADGGIEVRLDGLSLLGAGNLGAKQAELSLDAPRIDYQSTALCLPQTHLAIKALMDGDRLELPTFRIVTGNTTANLQGTATALTAQPVVDASLDIQSELAEIANVLAVSGDYSGRIKAGLTFKGPVANPAAKLALKMDQGLLAGRQVYQMRLLLNLEDRLATISDAAIELAGGTIGLDATVNLKDAFPSDLLTPPADVNALAYTLDLDFDIPELAPWVGPQAEIGGALEGKAHLEGTGTDPSAMAARLTLDAKGKHLSAPKTAIRPMDASLNLTARLEQGTAIIDRLAAATQGLNLAGTGSFGIQAKNLLADLKVDATDLAPVLALAGVEGARGSIDATVHAQGSLDRPQLALNLLAADLNTGACALGDLNLEADMDPEGHLNLTTLTLHNNQSHIQGSGRLRLQPGNFRIDPDTTTEAVFAFTTISAADFVPAALPVDGTLNGRLAINGPLKALQGDLTLKATSLARQGIAIGDLDTHLVWDNGTLHIQRLKLANQDSTLSAHGDMQLLLPGTTQPMDDPSFTVDLSSDHLDPEIFTDLAKGDFTLRASLDGSLGAPRGTITLEGKQITAGGQSIEALSLDGRLDPDKLWIDRLATQIASTGTIDVDGWVGMDRTLDIRLNADGIDLTDIGALNGQASIGGRLSATATARGTLENPDVSGKLTLADITGNGAAMHDMHLDFGLSDMRATAWGDIGFGLDAACDLRQGDFQADLLFDQTETAAYFKAAGFENLSGNLSGRISAAGNIHDAPHLKANVAIDALHLFSREISLVEADRLRMSLEDGTLSIPEFDMRLLSTGDLSLKGEASLNGSLNMQIDGHLPIAAAGAFVPDLVDAAGSIAINGRVSGTALAPAVDGRIDLDAIAMEIPGLAQKLHDLNGHIEVSGDTIRFRDVGGFLDTGSFGVDGTIGHEKFSPTDVKLAIKAKALPLEVPDTLSLLLNSDIDIAGQNGVAEASGKILILEGVYYKDVKISPLKLATTREREVHPESAPLSIPYFKTVNLDIDIGSRQPLTVQNNLADLEISPDLNLGGTLARPVVSGRAQVKEGTVTFQKKNFEVTKGVIDFVNPYKTEAEIDITSEATIRSWTITLSIKGPPDNLELKMTSDPTETDADILSLILLGRTSDELRNGEGGTKSSNAQIMAEMIASTFGEDIKKHTGVDILEVEETGDDDDEENGVKVTVGKHLSDRMTVKYAVESKGGEIVQQAISEYKLLENILISGFQGNDGVYGSELTFRIEFR